MLTSARLGTIPYVDGPFLIWLLIILKLPLVAALWLIWYAIKEPEPAADQDDGGSKVPDDPEPRPDRPRTPRRGPHATPPTPSPDRVRVAKGRTIRRPAGR